MFSLYLSWLWYLIKVMLKGLFVTTYFCLLCSPSFFVLPTPLTTVDDEGYYVKNSKSWGLKRYVEYFDRYNNCFLFDPYYSRVYKKIPLIFVSSFEMKNIKWSISKIAKITLDTKHALILKRNCVYVFYLKIAQYTIQKLNYILGYSIF